MIAQRNWFPPPLLAPPPPTLHLTEDADDVFGLPYALQDVLLPPPTVEKPVAPWWERQRKRSN